MSDLIDRQGVLRLLRMIPPEENALKAMLIQGVNQMPAQPSVSKTEIVGDVISRQAAIDVVRKAKDKSEAHRMLIQMPPAQSEPQWIPCDRGEPDEDMECWVTVKTTDALYRGNFTKRYGERRDKGFITIGGFMWWNTAIAWMPIYEPEPYRPEGDEKNGAD